MRDRMSIPGYSEYKSREFCKDVQCPVQLLLEMKEKGSEEHDRVWDICKKACLHTTREFHYWLMDKGYLIVKPEEKKV